MTAGTIVGASLKRPGVPISVSELGSDPVDGAAESAALPVPANLAAEVDGTRHPES